jgi:PAS domain S-box-containing protein
MKRIRQQRMPERRSRRLKRLVDQHEATQSERHGPSATNPHQDLPDWTDIKRYQELYEIAPVGFFTLDRLGRISELNENGSKLLGFPASWLLGRSFVVFVARQDVTRFLGVLRDAAQYPNETHIVRFELYSNRRIYPVQISVVAFPGSALIYKLTVVDLTDPQKTEDLLNHSLANWYSLVHNASDTVMIIESHGRISFVNRPIWGHSVDQLGETNLLDYVPEVQRTKVLDCLEQTFKYNRRTMCDITGLNGDWARWFNLSFGAPHEVAAAGRPTVRPGATTTVTTTLMIREISAQKRAEEILRMSGEQLRDFAARLDEVREEERTRVAREIHDELGQALTALKLDLAWVEGKTAAGEARKKIKQMIAHVDNTIACVRRISSALRPSILDDLGLIPAIEWQITEFRKRTGIRTILNSKADGLGLPSEAAAGVFRVVQEALTNIIRHAKASRVQVAVSTKKNLLKISIEDNGVGMALADVGLKSLGIVGMKERINRLGGQFNIVSEPGQGTRLDIIIPTKND